MTRTEPSDLDGSGEAPGSVIRLFLVGPIRGLDHDGNSIMPVNRKGRALLVVLALSDGMAASRRVLVSLLWSCTDSTLALALARLRDALHDLRKALGPFEAELMRIDGDRVSLRPGAIWIDALGEDGKAREGVDIHAIAADLEGLDTALDDWIARRRPRWRGGAVAASGTTPSSGTKPRPVPAAGERTGRRGTLIGVCPLKIMGPGVEDYLPVAIAEEIGTALAKLRWLTLISNASVASAIHSGQNLRAALGLELVLEGTVQRAGGRLRVNLQLVDTDDGSVVWSSRFEHADADLFVLQDQVAAGVAGSLEPEIPLIEAERVRRGGPTGSGAYGLALRAIPAIHLLDRRRFLEAGDLLQRAAELEPDYAAVHGWFALWSVFLVGQNWAKDPARALARAGEAAERAITLDPNDARGLTIAGHVRAYLYRRPKEAASLHQRALEINPSLSIAWMWSGMTHAYLGDLVKARFCIERCRALAPRDPHAFLQETALSTVELLSRDYAAAVERGRRATQSQPQFSAAYKPYLAALGHLGLSDEAVVTRCRLLDLEPEFSLRRFRDAAAYQRHEHIEHYANGLRLAGLR